MKKKLFYLIFLCVMPVYTQYEIKKKLRINVILDKKNVTVDFYIPEGLLNVVTRNRDHSWCNVIISSFDYKYFLMKIKNTTDQINYFKIIMSPFSVSNNPLDSDFFPSTINVSDILKGKSKDKYIKIEKLSKNEGEKYFLDKTNIVIEEDQPKLNLKYYLRGRITNNKELTQMAIPKYKDKRVVCVAIDDSIFTWSYKISIPDQSIFFIKEKPKNTKRRTTKYIEIEDLMEYVEDVDGLSKYVNLLHQDIIQYEPIKLSEILKSEKGQKLGCGVFLIETADVYVDSFRSAIRIRK